MNKILFWATLCILTIGGKAQSGSVQWHRVNFNCITNNNPANARAGENQLVWILLLKTPIQAISPAAHQIKFSLNSTISQVLIT